MSVAGESELQLARPVLGEREEELVLEVLRSGRLSLGPMLERFEREFAEWVGVDHAVAVSSGTAALHLGVRGLGWGAGDEVITSPLSFVASVNCLLYEDVRPVFCDIDADTWNLDPDEAEDAIGERTKGILPVHIFGYPADMARFEAIAESRGLDLLEDACEALGARDSRGLRVGSGPGPATFAFYANKQMTTGEGGMLCTADSALAERARSERNQGRAVDMGWLDHERLGFNYRLSELACALGVAQVESLGALLAGRDRVADLYRERLDSLDEVRVPIAEAGQERRSWFVFVVQLLEGRGGEQGDLEIGERRDAVIEALGRRGIPAKAYMPCLHLMEHVRPLGYRPGQFPIAESVAASTLALPFHPEMAESEVDRVCEALQAALGT